MLAGYIEIILLTNWPFSTENSEIYYSMRKLLFLLDAPTYSTMYMRK